MFDFGNVYSPRPFDPTLAQEIASAYPEALIIFHPVFRRWQLYERRNQAWDAKRLYETVLNFRQLFEEWAEGKASRPFPWWETASAPHIVAEWEQEPGPWILRGLRHAQLAQRGGHKALLQRDEEIRAERERDRKRRQADLIHDATDAGHRHLADALREDPLAGKRRWVYSVSKDLKEGSHAAPIE